MYGPYPKILCDLDYLLKNILTLKLILFINVSLVVRYIFVFHSKNRTAYQDDFWIFYLNILAYSQSYLTHLRMSLTYNCGSQSRINWKQVIQLGHSFVRTLETSSALSRHLHFLGLNWIWLLISKLSSKVLFSNIFKIIVKYLMSLAPIYSCLGFQKYCQIVLVKN